jgi:hypothetical protein
MSITTLSRKSPAGDDFSVAAKAFTFVIYVHDIGETLGWRASEEFAPDQIRSLYAFDHRRGTANAGTVDILGRTDAAGRLRMRRPPKSKAPRSIPELSQLGGALLRPSGPRW